MTRRWTRHIALSLLAVVAATAVVLGWGSAAQASPHRPAVPLATCHWEITTGDDFDMAELQCVDENGEWTNPDGVRPEDVPPLPEGCESQRDENTGDSPVPNGPRPTTIRCAKPNMEWVDCRDEHDFFFDDTNRVQIPRDAPQWWKDEIRIESSSEVDPQTHRELGDEGRGCQLARHVPQRLCSQVDLDQYHSPGLLPDQCWGTYPTSNYAVSWDDGGIFDFDNKMQGWTGSFMFNIGKGAIVTSLWLVGWAFSFDITEYTQFAADVADRYNTNIVLNFGLQDIMWFSLIVWAGFTTLRGRIGMAAGEILVAVVLAGLATVLFTHRADYMNSVAELMDETSARLLVAGQTERCVPSNAVPPGSRSEGAADCGEGEVQIRLDPQRPANLVEEVRPLQQHIHEAFIEQPYAYLNWGRVTTGRCLQAQNEIIGVGYNSDGWPERHMRRAGCEQEANYSHDVTGEKMLGAFLTMAAALVVAFLLGLMALTVVMSKFLVALLFAIIPFAALAAILPGGARRMAWSWLSALLQLILAVVCMSFLLALLMLGVDEILGVTNGLGLVERWFIVLLIVSAVFFARRRLMSGSKSIGENLANTLTRLTPAGALSNTSNWGGFNIAGIDRAAGFGTGYAALGGAMAAMAAGRVARSRLAERRVARRGYRNLERMERTRERPQLEYRFDGYRFHGGPAAAAGAAAAPKALPPGARPKPGSRPGPASAGPGPHRGSQPTSPPSLAPSQMRGAADLSGFAGGAGGAVDPGGWSDSGGGAGPPGPVPGPSAAPPAMGRERYEVVMKTRVPPSGLRHPIRNLQARWRLDGNKAKLGKVLGGPLSGQSFRPVPRGRSWRGWP